MNHRRKMLKRIGLLTFAGVVLLALFLAVWNPAFSFQPETPLQRETARSSSIVATEPVAAAVLALADDASKAESLSHQEQTSPSVADIPSSDNCIACHTDKEQLQAVAEEPEEVKSEEASGEG